MQIYDIVIIGAGAAGLMAAIRAADFDREIALIERNDSVGKKILVTGNGRCNITNAAPIKTLIEKFGKHGIFLRPSFYNFSNKDLIDFFEQKGLKLKIEKQDRVFPVTDQAQSVVDLLRNSLMKKNVKIFYNTRLERIYRKEEGFEISTSAKSNLSAKKVILATGGVSYPETGSTGDGFDVASDLGHKIMPLRAALVPLKVKELWVKDLQGLGLKNIRITFQYEKKRIISPIGELMFTHFGVSGPLVLDLSGKISSLLEEGKDVKLLIDLKPGLDKEKLKQKLIDQFQVYGKSKLSTILKKMLPKRMIPVFVERLGLMEGKQVNQMLQKERYKIADAFKALEFTIAGTLSIKKGMVTDGGVCIKEINPKTMESKLVSGLFFAGEIIDGTAPSGGYSLQQAFSTGYLAGEAAARI